MRPKEKSPGRIITFYSYKGGVGRTMALANVACILARWGYSVLCVDWDLEAPGLHYYLRSKEVSTTSSGMIDLILNQSRREDEWQSHVIPVPVLQTKRRFDLLSAGSQTENYVKRVHQIDWPKLYSNHQMGSYIEQLRFEWKRAYDFILIDSRTGITDTGGICTLQLPDLVVLLFTANYQGLEGIDQIARSIGIEHSNLAVDRPQLSMLPVLTSFAGRTEIELGRTWLKLCEDRLGFVYSKWAHRDAALSEIINLARVPYVPYWSFGETLPVLEESDRDPETISYAFGTIAAMVQKSLSQTDLLVRNRDSYVESARRDSLEDVTVYYAKADRDVAEELKKHISPLLRQGVIGEWVACEISDQLWDCDSEERVAAGIVLILVSPDLWATGFRSGSRLKQLLKKHSSGEAVVIPVIVRYANWTESELGKLAAQPQDGVPIVRFENPDSAYAQVASSVRSAAEQLARPTHKELNVPQSPKRAVSQIFLSYSHKDRALAKQLEIHLRILQRSGTIQLWHDREISPGDNWAESISEAMEASDIVLFLVSSDFLASDYCYGREVKRALERATMGNARVIPVILRPAIWQETPFGKLQALPRGGRPVTEWPSTDDALMDTIEGLKAVLDDTHRSELAAQIKTSVTADDRLRTALEDLQHNTRFLWQELSRLSSHKSELRAEIKAPTFARVKPSLDYLVKSGRLTYSITEKADKTEKDETVLLINIRGITTQLRNLARQLSSTRSESSDNRLMPEGEPYGDDFI